MGNNQISNMFQIPFVFLEMDKKSSARHLREKNPFESGRSDSLWLKGHRKKSRNYSSSPIFSRFLPGWLANFRKRLIGRRINLDFSLPKKDRERESENSSHIFSTSFLCLPLLWDIFLCHSVSSSIDRLIAWPAEQILQETSLTKVLW